MTGPFTNLYESDTGAESTQDRFLGLEFGRRYEKAAGLKGYLNSKPMCTEIGLNCCNCLKRGCDMDFWYMNRLRILMNFSNLFKGPILFFLSTGFECWC